MSKTDSSHPGRRQLLQAAGLGSLLAALPPARAAAPAESGDLLQAQSEVRLALLMGNSEYPAPFDLPPIPKNVHDLRYVLEQRGFVVSDALNGNLPASRKTLDDFIAKAAAAPADATLLFYFSGHGIQVDASNLLLPAGLDPSGKPDTLRGGSVKLIDDVILKIPPRKGGTIVAIVDACRTSLKAGADGGLNQVVAPADCLIAFSTGAGRPAVAPAVADRSTFYTASLVKLMESTSDQTQFRDLFQLVRTDVRETMLHHPVEAIRRLAQDSFIADSTRASCTLAPRGIATAAGPALPDAEQEEQDFQALTDAVWPADVVERADAFLKAHPKSAHAPAAMVAKNGGAEALKALRRREVRLFKTAFDLPAALATDEDMQRDLHRAGRGDKDAAARIAQIQRNRRDTANWMNRYEGWLQLASALGNGIASYDLALHYRSQNQPLLSSQWESRAREQGYTPPPSLDNVRK
ncbi:caspase family protein [Pelomonas sp. KK5]|uniref:caspase family protein n=1 Tax=Pelomonas sp. KK5 TaxID=1855730 RepID=UPI00097C7B08|nr:caspase family protein [Pelomonas sp. KK5]